MKADDAAYPMPEGSENGVYTLTLDGPGSAKIPQVKTDELGVYTYTIRQVAGDCKFAKSYDATVYKYTVAVTKDKATGKIETQAWLSLEGKEEKPDKCAFVNSYVDPTPVRHDPPVKKVINTVPEGNPSFTFTLTAISNTVGIEPKDMPIPEGGANGVMTVEVKAGEEREFGWLVFDGEGSYVYEITEENTHLPHVTYDETVYQLTYDITLNRETWEYEKVLTIRKDGSVVDKATFDFTNDYAPQKPVSDTVRVKKNVTGDTPSTTSTFKFTLTAKSNTAGLATTEMPMPSGAANGKVTVEVKGGEEKDFGTLSFSQAGTYVYELSEVDTKIANYTYDKATYTLTYNVTDDGTKLTVAKSVTKDGAAFTESVLSFSNKYDKPEEEKKGGPKTGVQDYWPYLLGGAALLLAAAAVMLIYLRRGRKEEE